MATKATTDHEVIRQWVEDRGGQPAAVKATASDDDVGIIRVDMPGYSGDNLEKVSWNEWFQKFDENNLAFLYQEETQGGEKSNFSKLVKRDTAQGDDSVEWR